MTQTSVKTRRKFDETFKREAVNNWLASRKSAEVVAEELGISANRLYAWKQRFAPAAAGGRAGAGAKRGGGPGPPGWGARTPRPPPPAGGGGGGGGKSPGPPADLQSQLNTALREMRHLREQRDILKKTLAILSEPSPNAMNG